MSRLSFEIASFRWWAIVAVVFGAVFMFITYDYHVTKSLHDKGIKLNNKIAQLEPVNFANVNPTRNIDNVLMPVIIRGSIGFAMASLLLLLIGNRRKIAISEKLSNSENPSWLYDNLPFGIALWSSKGKLIACNAYYKDKLNLTHQEAAKGTCYIDIMSNMKSKQGFKIVSDEELVRQIELIEENGEAIFIDERPISNDGFITIISDISARVQLEQELKKFKANQRKLVKQLHEETIKAESASRSKTSFLAHLSHDIRTPLNHIIGFADLMVHQTYGELGDKRYLTYINDIKTSGEKLLMSFSEILELAQLEAGEIALKEEDVKVKDLVSNVEKKYRSRAKKADLVIKTNVCDEALLHIDRMCCERMIGNIVENAIQFTPKGGEIKINVWSADDGVVLEISDNGIGMSPERIKDLSQPFVLGDAAFTREGGMGLGIAISRTIAELSGGELAIDSSPALGTTVAISLPLKASAKAKKQQAA